MSRLKNLKKEINEYRKYIPDSSRYADEPTEWERKELLAQKKEEWREEAAGEFWIRAELYWKKEARMHLSTAERRNAEQVVSSTLGKKQNITAKKIITESINGR